MEGNWGELGARAVGFAKEGCQPHAEEEGRCLCCSPCHIPAACPPLPLPAFPAPYLPMASAPPMGLKSQVKPGLKSPPRLHEQQPRQ